VVLGTKPLVLSHYIPISLFVGVRRRWRQSHWCVRCRDGLCQGATV